MKLRSLYRLAMLTMTGAVVFQATASCSTEAIDTFTTTVAQAISTLINSEITAYLNQYLTGTT
jgi:hypothetical protein